MTVLTVTVSSSPAAAEDHDFLTAGGVFTDDLIDAWIAEKRKDVLRAEMAVTALDFDLYYSH